MFEIVLQGDCVFGLANVAFQQRQHDQGYSAKPGEGNEAAGEALLRPHQQATVVAGGDDAVVLPQPVSNVPKTRGWDVAG